MRLVVSFCCLIITCDVFTLVSTEISNEEQPPLKTKDLFQNSENYKCLVEGKSEHCSIKSKDEKDGEYFGKKHGPRFQKVHLELARLEPIKVGFERKIQVKDGKPITIKTLSIQPPVFEIPNFLEEEECDAIIYLAKEKGMKKHVPTLRSCGLPNKVLHHDFDQWDMNFDGMLSKAEIAAIPELASFLLNDADIGKMINSTSLDKDGDDLISFVELNDSNMTEVKACIDSINKNKSEQASADVQQAWLWQDEEELLSFNDVLLNYHERLENLTQIPKELIEQTEPLQVVRHGKGSSSSCHHDSDALDYQRRCCTGGDTGCRMCRYLTLMYFLNDVPEGGELAFPLADGHLTSAENISQECTVKCSWNRSFPMANLRVKPEKGKAVLWYNHLIEDGTGWMGDLDSFSLQSEAEVVQGEKWTAKMWLDIVGDGVHVIRPWKLGSNWLDGVNKNKVLIEKMRNDHFIEGVSYYHSRFKYTKEYNRPLNKISSSSSKHVHSKDSQMTERDLQTESTAKETISNEDDISIVTIEDSKQINKSDNDNVNSDRIELSPDTSEDISLQKLPVPPKPKRRDHKPLGPPPRTPFPGPLPAGNMEGNKLVRSILLLIDELERDELEIVARVLHEKLQLACIPLMVNPVGPI